MAKLVLIPAGLALVLSLAACDRADRPVRETAGEEATAAGADAVKQVDAAFITALEAKDMAAIKAHYAPDAVMVLPGQPPMRGIDAISASYDEFAADPAGKFDATSESTVAGGDMAYSQGTYTVTWTNPQTKEIENGQGYYVVVYRKQPDGSWKIVQDVSSPTPLPSPRPTAG